MRSRSLLLAPLVLVACSTTHVLTTSDAGPTDGGDPLDAHVTTERDAGVADAGEAVTDAGTAALDAGSPSDDAGSAIESGSAELLVYTSNIENLEEPTDGCPGDWRDLFYYMRHEDQAPHIVLFQQITDSAQLGRLTRFMSDQLGHEYRGIIAEADPTSMRSPCGAQKARQTNAIVYRRDVLAPAGDHVVWHSYWNPDGECVRDSHSRTHSLMQGFTDLRTDREIAVASIHWSTSQTPGADRACAAMNAEETDRRLRARHPDASLYLFGGDTNEPELRSSDPSADYFGWYRRTNGDLGGALGWRDPIFDRCGPDGRKRCLLDNWTIGMVRRIDFLFFARPSGMPNVLRAHTVTFAEADAAARAVDGRDDGANYSDHRAVFARVRYRWP